MMATVAGENPRNCKTCVKKYGMKHLKILQVDGNNAFYATDEGVMFCGVDGKPIAFVAFMRTCTHGCASHGGKDTCLGERMLAGEEKELKLIADLLYMAGNHFGDHACTDLDERVFSGWSVSERKDFVKKYHEFNGDPDEYDDRHLVLPDFAVMCFLAARASYRAGSKTQPAPFPQMKRDASGVEGGAH